MGWRSGDPRPARAVNLSPWDLPSSHRRQIAPLTTCHAGAALRFCIPCGSHRDRPSPQGRPRRRHRRFVDPAGTAEGVGGGGVGAGQVARRGGPPGRGGHLPGDRVGGDAGKNELGLSGPILARVDEAAKAKLLELIEQAMEKGWSMARACHVLDLDGAGRGGGRPGERPAPWPTALGGGNPVHKLFDWEEQGDRGAVRDVGAGRPVASQAGPSRVVPSAGVGVTLDGGPGPGSSRPGAHRR